MPSIIVTLKPDVSLEELEKAKKTVQEQGGQITHEFTLIKAFAATFPDDKIYTLQSNDHFTVEADGEVTTQ